MLSINMNDVITVIGSIRTQLIALVLIIILAVIVQIAVMKLAKPEKKLIRGCAFLAAVLGILICINSMLTGPLRSLLDLTSSSGEISEESKAEAKDLAVEIAEEGTLLLENDGILPLASGTKLNVFGWASTNPLLGGGGSGALNDMYESVSLLDSLKNAGFETNTELSDFYTSYADTRPTVGMWDQDWTLPEPNVSRYSDDLINNAKSFSDTALIVIGRSGGEGADLPYDMPAVADGSWKAEHDTTGYFRGVYDDSFNEGNDWDAGDHYLQLNNREEELVELVTSNFDNVIVIFNISNGFEMGFLKDYPQIKGAIWAAPGGHVGMTALGEIMSGKVNPSAKLFDTIVYDLQETPWWNNFGDAKYTNMQEFEFVSTDFNTGAEQTEKPAFVNYVEGIYVGYRFYETAAAEGLINYDDVVQYPFGYGLSYTTFDQSMSDISESGNNITFDVTVTNTGSVAGKDVVEVYSNPPYTNGGIEKATANLIQFEKTGVIEPGASETVKVTVSKDDLMSYDYKGQKGYVLEAGDYIISVNSDSHTILDSKVYSVGSAVTDKESDVTKATNRFDYAAGDIEYLSRADGFANYAVATAAPTSYEMSAEAKAGFVNNSNYLNAQATAADEDANAEPITTGASGSLKLSDMTGLDKDDPKWDQLMDQLTIDEMNSLIALGGYQTNSIESIDKVQTADCDGPASINNNFTGKGSIGFPIGIVIAADWNKELAYRFGESIGTMADEMDVSGWYAPAMNIHRTAFAGRNFEYYSEDGILSGWVAAQAVKGSQDKGVYAYMKHFALNDQEGNRCDMVCTWTNEQAMREIYLRPFEKCVKEAGCLAVMSSFNYIGNRWAGGTKELQINVLRDEWGFNGFVETDFFGGYGYMNADQAVRNGTDLMLCPFPSPDATVNFNTTNGAQQAIRRSAKNILYVVANSRAYTDFSGSSLPAWRIALYVVDVVIAVLLVLGLCLLLKKYKARKAG